MLLFKKKKNLRAIVAESLESKRFECTIPAASKVYSFSLTTRSTQKQCGWGWTQQIRGGYLIFTDQLERVKIVTSEKELRNELSQFYKGCARKSLGLKP